VSGSESRIVTVSCSAMIDDQSSMAIFWLDALCVARRYSVLGGERIEAEETDDERDDSEDRSDMSEAGVAGGELGLREKADPKASPMLAFLGKCRVDMLSRTEREWHVLRATDHAQAMALRSFAQLAAGGAPMVER